MAVELEAVLVVDDDALKQSANRLHILYCINAIVVAVGLEAVLAVDDDTLKHDVNTL